MRATTPSAVALVALLVPQGDLPNIRVLVATTATYVAAYERTFVELVADEQTTQEVRKAGVVTATRATRGELFASYVPGDGAWMSVHDIAEVDGVPVEGHESVRVLLARESLRAVASRVAAANARYNIGSVRRNFNEPTLALLPFTSRYRSRFDFDRGPVDRSALPRLLVTIEFKDKDGNAIVRSEAGRVRLRGSAVVDVATGVVQHTSLMLTDGRGTATLSTTFALDEHVGSWVPIEFTEAYVDPRARETTTVRTVLSNYRRFGVSVRIK